MKSRSNTPRLVIGMLAALPIFVPLHSAFAASLQIVEAAKQGRIDVVRSLIKQNTDVNSALPDGTTALHWAALNGDVALAKLLLAAGAKPAIASRIGGITPLISAAANGSTGIVAALLRAGADSNTADTNGGTPLMAAAASGNTEAVKALLDRGAKIDAVELVHGQTALMFAAAKDRPDVIRLLIARGANPKITSTVIRLGRPRFDEDGNPLGGDPTGAAGGAGRGRRPRGGGAAPPLAKPASTAAADGSGADDGPEGFIVAPARRPQRTQGASRRAAAITMGGNTALWLAAREGNFAAVQALVEAKVDVNEANAGDKTTPLVTAICNGHYDLAKYLLDYGADPNQESVDGLAALYAVIDAQYAPQTWTPNPITGQEQIGHLGLMMALLDKGANPNAQLTKKLWFRPTHHDECWIGTAGSTPFWRAAQAADLDAMKLLISRGADPKIATSDADSALMVAAGLGWNGNFTIQAPYSALDIVKYCLELGLDPLAQDVQGYTALCGAAYRGDNNLINLLIERGAKLDTRNSRGWSVTDMANGPSLRSSVPVKHPESVALLLKLGSPPLTATDDEEILGIIRRRAAAQSPQAPPKTP